MEEHHKALESDLMRCGYELNDVGHSLSWGALHSFVRTLGPSSAVARDIDPEVHQWSTTANTNKILADIYDLLAQINANLVAVGSHKPSKKPKPYPRPKSNSGDKYGKGAVTVQELRKLYADKRKKRRKHGGS